jgi:maltose alpha-D-glucosyltransferase / alpha-amylase
VPLYFNFLFNNTFYLALARENATPFREMCIDQPADPESWVWVNFLRNLDEVDLERISDSEREEVYQAFAPDDDMKVYSRGIRRRLGPMLGGDVRRMKMAFSLLLSLPGSPMLVYGDEIGMGDDLSLPERESVRLPMQWSSGSMGGFSTSPHHSDINAPIAGGQFGYERVNVESQLRDDESLLAFVRRAIHQRRELPHFVESRGEVLQSSTDAVLAFGYEHEQGKLVALHNFSRDVQFVAVDGVSLTEMQPLISDETSRAEQGRREYCLAPHGYVWLQSQPQGIAATTERSEST